MGTPYYMAPEQCEGKTEIDHRADIYSLGVLLFEMLTGKVPFGGDGYGEIIVKHITMPPPSVRSLVPELTPELDLILFRALAKDRTQRFQTMAELRDALLDPNRYASAAPVVAVPDDLSGVARAASPMARSEMDIQNKLGPAWLRLRRRRCRPPDRHGAVDVPPGHGRDHRRSHAQAEDEPRAALRRARVDDGRRHRRHGDGLAARGAPAAAHRGAAVAARRPCA